jgi:arsenite methyltransferase
MRVKRRIGAITSPEEQSAYHMDTQLLMSSRIKPGGRLAISDVDYSEKPAHEVKSRFEAIWAGCVGGAMEEQAYFDLILQAGFEEIRIVARHSLGPTELEEMASCPSPEFTPRPEKADLVAVQGTVTSIKFTAAKPFPRR